MSDIEKAGDRAQARYKTNRSLIRGLRILHELNEIDEGRATPSEIAERTGIHRTTVHRILDTLECEGYVARSHTDHSFILTTKMAKLSSGLTDEVKACSAAAPILQQLQAAVTWPTDLCFPKGENMVIRESTHRSSTLSFHRQMPGRTIPMLHTAAGRAYFAFASKDTQREILDMLARRSAPEDDALLGSPGRLQKLMAKIRADGYATNDGEWDIDKRVGAIASPIFSNGLVCGSLNIIFLRNVIPLAEAIKRYTNLVVKAARQIEQAMSIQQAGAPAVPVTSTTLEK